MTLDPTFVLAAVMAVSGAVAAFVAVKFATRENNRLMTALHRRFDGFEIEMRNEVGMLREASARHDERIKALRNTQRIRAVEVGEGGGEG